MKNKSEKNKIKIFLKKYWIGILLLAFIFSYFTLPIIIDGFSSVETNTCKCLEKSKYKYRTGAICKDGWHSNATGRGACSHHGGVREWIYGEAYSKTRAECEELAKHRSWIE